MHYAIILWRAIVYLVDGGLRALDLTFPNSDRFVHISRFVRFSMTLPISIIIRIYTTRHFGESFFFSPHLCCTRPGYKRDRCVVRPAHLVINTAALHRFSRQLHCTRALQQVHDILFTQDIAPSTGSNHVAQNGTRNKTGHSHGIN